MAALTKPRIGSLRVITRDKRPLAANAKVFQGALAVAILSGPSGGYYAQGQAGSVVAVGRFKDTVDNTGGANGALSAEIEFFKERWIYLLDNDTASAVVVGDRENGCYILDDHTVTHASGGNGPAGVVYDVTAEGIWVEVRAPLPGLSGLPGGQAVPNIQSGTSALVAGTKTIAGVTLTANSVIVPMMRDPGAGAIPAFATLDAPAAGRTLGANGSFVVNAIDNTKAVIATAGSTFDWLVIG
jgi:hypothetical protein